MDSYNRQRVLALSFTCQLLTACATVSRHPHDDQPMPRLPSPTVIRVAADEGLGSEGKSEGEELRLAVTGSQPFSYHLGYDEATSSLIMDIPRACFIHRPKRLTIGNASGFTNAAALSRISIVRTVDGIERPMRVNVADILKRGRRRQDITLAPDDIVVVPASVS